MLFWPLGFNIQNTPIKGFQPTNVQNLALQAQEDQLSENTDSDDGDFLDEGNESGSDSDSD